MNIEYRNSQSFSPEQLRELFLSVEWESGEHPEKLVVAMKNSGTVFSAWDGNKLVGLVNALDDGAMTAYIHFLLVNPEYHNRGIGSELLRLTTERYKDYLRIVLVAYSGKIEFYQKNDFEIGKETTAMFRDSF